MRIRLWLPVVWMSRPFWAPAPEPPAHKPSGPDGNSKQQQCLNYMAGKTRFVRRHSHDSSPSASATVFQPSRSSSLRIAGRKPNLRYRLIAGTRTVRVMR